MTTRQNVRGSTRDYSYNILKKKILRLELEPGTKISEKEMADELNVSRTPIREAFMKLAQEELLDIIPQSGTVVSKINLQHVEEGRFIREKIEKEIVTLVCSKFAEDDRFKLESNLAMQRLCSDKKNLHNLQLDEEFFQLDEEFHQILFSSCGKARTWEMLQMLNNHFNRLRLLRLSSSLNWEIIISQHHEIYRLILNQDVDCARKMMEEHLNLVVIEQNELRKAYPHYFI